MRSLFSFALLAFFSLSLSAQVRFNANNRGVEVKGELVDTLANPWAGGMLNPEFSNIDVNHDGLQDLFVFEAMDSRGAFYIKQTNGSYLFAPEYSYSLPPLFNFALIRDYDGDGKGDLFTYSTEASGMAVYRNISSGDTLRFKLAKGLVLYHEPTFDLNLYIPPTDMPVLTDMDGDGDLDVLSYDVLQSFVKYYRNVSVEKYGNRDSLEFTMQDRCWGKFEKSASSNSVILGMHCKKGMHGGSTLNVIDMDGDGDKDLLLGDLQFNNIFLLMNGREKNNGIDSMISIDTLFPSSSKNIYIRSEPAVYFVDINGDSLTDMLVSPLNVSDCEFINQVWYYVNTGTAKKPQFTYVRNNFLQSSMIDLELLGKPATLDYDHDGLTDLVISAKGNSTPGYEYDKLVLYHNVGSKKYPKLEKVDNDFAGLSSLQASHLSPAFADLNGDGKPDMLLGNYSGKVMYYINNGSLSNPQFTQQSAEWQGIDVGNMSTPAIADLNGDSLLDLIIGCKDGTLSYYRNSGSKTNPAMTLISDSFGSIHTNYFFYEYDYDNQGNPIDSTLRMEEIGASSPALADVDHNGKLDMISGSYKGKVFYFHDFTDNLSGVISESSSPFYSLTQQRFKSYTTGHLSHPALGYMDQDTIPDLFVGSYRGGAYYFSSTIPENLPAPTDRTEIRKTAERSAFKIYPQPAHDMITVDGNFSPSKDNKYQIYDICGRQLQNAQFPSSRKIDVANLKPGIYLLRIESEDAITSIRLLKE